MTKTGSDHLKRRARALARATGRRYPDVLAELRRPTAPPAPSQELVRVCGRDGFDWGGIGRCTRPYGHLDTDPSSWPSCGDDPHYPVHIWHGYFKAEDEASRAQTVRWWNSLTPEQREEEEELYWAELAADAAGAMDSDFY